MSRKTRIVIAGICVLFCLMGCVSTSWEYDRPDLVSLQDPSDMWREYSWSTEEWVIEAGSYPGFVVPAKHVCLYGAHMNHVWLVKDMGYAETASKAKIMIRRDLGAKW